MQIQRSSTRHHRGLTKLNGHGEFTVGLEPVQESAPSTSRRLHCAATVSFRPDQRHAPRIGRDHAVHVFNGSQRRKPPSYISWKTVPRSALPPFKVALYNVPSMPRKNVEPGSFP